MSAAAAIPFVGWAATGAKFAIKGAKLVKKAGKVVDSVVGAATKIADKAGQVAKAIGDLANKAGDAISGALGKVMTKAKGLASNFSPADLANKLKGKLDALIMKSPMLGNGLKMAGGMAKGFMQNLLMSEAMNYGLEQLSQYVDSDTMTKAMILMSMLSGKSKKNQNQGITSNNKGSGDKDKSKDKPKDKDKTKDKTQDKGKDEPNEPKPKDIDDIDYGKYLKKHIGEPPSDMYDPHAHQILFKKGNGKTQKELVKEGHEILIEFGIDPIMGLENLVWAPNRVKGQHVVEALRYVVTKLKEVKEAGGDREDMVEMLRILGDIAKRRG